MCVYERFFLLHALMSEGFGPRLDIQVCKSCECLH